jgi:hypothetical protein
MPIDPDYVDVAERIASFFEKYPDGRLRPLTPWQLREVGNKLFVVYEAAAYRTPDDEMPGIGTAWEPFPGPTPFTHDSELMNAETSAWGRAIIAVGIASKRVATQQDVEARQQPTQAPPAAAKPATQPRARKGATDAQRRRIHALISEKAVTRLELANVLANWDIQLVEGWMDRLGPGRDGTASQLIDELAKFGPKIPERDSDLPSDPLDFAPEVPS